MTAAVFLAAASPAAAPAWVSYVGLAVAGLSALGVVSNFLSTHHREQRKQRERYAEHISAWTGPRVPEVARPGKEDSAESWGHRFRTIIVNNGSEQPVYNTVVAVPTPEAELLPEEEPLLYCAVGLIPPGEKIEVDIGEAGQFCPQFAAPLQVYFTDAQRIPWYRDEDGKLHRNRARPDDESLGAGEGTGFGRRVKRLTRWRRTHGATLPRTQ
ncbi:hypothetical protein CUT44_14225 [Streptomyces carminius]|uniref:Uncharacterized protein n=1 Tax=Streptomyces carminius TaxID=2665496 RepID=A0A2M8LYX4_9ACTN|nr:hypothetical protein [Streptomyces carminius]PJE97135.1 hypothetical protein CUT44_14225 [Streptomyces carminius]